MNSSPAWTPGPALGEVRIQHLLQSPRRTYWSINAGHEVSLWLQSSPGSVDERTVLNVPVDTTRPFARAPALEFAPRVPQNAAGLEAWLVPGEGVLLGHYVYGATKSIPEVECLVSIGRRLGRGLAQLHGGGPAWPGTATPGALSRLISTSHSLEPAARRSLTRILDAGLVKACVVHGAPASASIHVGPGRVPASVCLLMPAAWAQASPAFDVGHLLADLVELAQMPSVGDVQISALVDMAEAVRSSYEDSVTRGLPTDFWSDVLAAAQVKIVDHRERLAARVEGVSVALSALTELVHSLASPSSSFAHLFR